MKDLKTPKEIIAEVLKLNVDQLNDDSAYGKTPNWDSLNHLAIINELETNYGVQIPDEDIEKYTSIQTIIEFVDSIKS